MKYPMIVFDWDGTLFDSTALIIDSIQQSAADLNLPIPTRERARHVIGLGLQDALRYAVPEATPQLVPKIVERYRHHYLSRDGEITLFEGIKELLQTLRARGHRLAVATGKSRAGLNRCLVASGMQTWFEMTRCADEGFSKPHPWMLQDIAEQSGLQTRDLLMIGDTTHDLQLAANAGASFFGVGYGAHAARELNSPPSLGVAQSVAGLKDFLLGLNA